MSSFQDLTVNESMAPSIQVMNQDLIRLDRFEGHNFTRWQEKVLFFLTAIKLSYILSDDFAPILEEKADDSDECKKELQEQRKKRNDDDFLCRGHILNALSDSVYSAHRTIGTTKELWLALDNKYRIEEASNQKCNYFDFKMTDSKFVLAQVHELQLIVSNLNNAEIVLPCAFQVGAIIAKLPSSWNGYKKKLKHDETKHTLESLIRHLRIEEDSCKRENNDQAAEKANMVQENHKGNKKRKNSSSKQNYAETSKKKFKGDCFYCKKFGHTARECQH
ncbi:uncharacterized protein LOC111403231 [Olea europaea var. sylvestris]|uniref:uncharacterized protein LOC111403231 n=1 Tax=Olea europaea var. sylvestris TaxID=158386 RepID=UPI000C1CD515|nr:uncharacterized protein LOC111403231 [Olea europaea var. sylvestris]